MREWLDEFYGSPQTRAALEDSFAPIVTDLGTSVAAIAGSEVGISEPAVGAFIQAMVSSYVENYLSSSRAQLTDLLDSPDPKAAIQQRVGEWLEKRPGKVADEATHRTANAVTQTVYKDAGATHKRWNARGNSCPYCRRMDGRVVDIERPFHQAGDEIEVPDAEIAALKAKLNFTHEIGHPPQHSGCDCSLEVEIIKGDDPARGTAGTVDPNFPLAVLGEPFPTKAPHPDTGWAEPHSRITLKSGTQAKLSSYGDAVPGGYNGGWALFEESTGRKMGFLDYQSASGSGSVLIGMVEVDPAFRGKGVSDGLLSRLVAEFEGAKIDPGMMTEAGSAWWKRVKKFVPHED